MIFEKAAADIRYLLDRGYPQKSAVGFVCAHYRLDIKARYLLSRTVLSHEVSGNGRQNFYPAKELKKIASLSWLQYHYRHGKYP